MKALIRFPHNSLADYTDWEHRFGGEPVARNIFLPIHSVKVKMHPQIDFRIFPPQFNDLVKIWSREP